MTSLVVMRGNQAMTTSVQISEVFGKQHSHVIEAIENKIQSVENSIDYKSMFKEGTYRDKRNRIQKQYLLNRDGFTFIAFGFTGSEADKFKLDFIKAFNKMEQSIKQQVQIPTNPMDALKLMFEVQTETDLKVEDITDRVVELEENVPLSVADYGVITKNVSQRVYQVIRERKLILNDAQRRELFKDINGSIKKITGARNRANLRTKHYDTVYQFIIDWQPSTATLMIIRSLGDE